MKAITPIAVLIGALAFLPAHAAQPDFTGTWVLDGSRSEGLPPGTQQTLQVKQSGDRIEIVLHVKGPAGEQRIEDVYVVDGRETSFQPVFNVPVESTGRRTARWSQARDGFEAAEQATARAPEGEMTITATRRWTLSPDGDVLTTEQVASGPQGEMKSTRVYTRQKPAGG